MCYAEVDVCSVQLYSPPIALSATPDILYLSLRGKAPANIKIYSSAANLNYTPICRIMMSATAQIRQVIMFCLYAGIR